MRALIPSTVPACLRSLPRPSLTLSPSEFELYMQALTPTPQAVPAGFRQPGSQPVQTSLPTNGITTSPLLLTTPPLAFPRPILLTTPPVLDYSDDIVFLSHPPHFVYQSPAPLPDNSITIAAAITVIVWIVLFM